MLSVVLVKTMTNCMMYFCLLHLLSKNLICSDHVIFGGKSFAYHFQIIASNVWSELPCDLVNFVKKSFYDDFGIEINISVLTIFSQSIVSCIAG